MSSWQWDMQGQKLLAVQEANVREQTSYKQKQAELEGSKEQVCLQKACVSACHCMQ